MVTMGRIWVSDVAGLLRVAGLLSIAESRRIAGLPSVAE
jgi:hypothetical protein